MDPWFLYQIKEITDTIAKVGEQTAETLTPELLRKAKRQGISTSESPRYGTSPRTKALPRSGSCGKRLGIRPVYKLVDTCAAEFESLTPYLYSTATTRRTRRRPPRSAKSLFWGAGRTASGRELSSITAAAMRRSRCRKTATRPSWSTAIRRPSHSRRRLVEGDGIVRAGRWATSCTDGPFLGREVTGSTIGIVGLGRIGSAVARRARAFDMRVLVHRRTPVDDAGYRGLDDLLREADVVSLHVPLSAATQGLISRERLALLRDGATLVNTSRGAIVDEDALVAESVWEDRRGARRVRARARGAARAARPPERRALAAHRQRDGRDARGDDAGRRRQRARARARRAAAHPGARALGRGLVAGFQPRLGQGPPVTPLPAAERTARRWQRHRRTRTRPELRHPAASAQHSPRNWLVGARAARRRSTRCRSYQWLRGGPRRRGSVCRAKKTCRSRSQQIATSSRSRRGIFISASAGSCASRDRVVLELEIGRDLHQVGPVGAGLVAHRCSSSRRAAQRPCQAGRAAPRRSPG